MLWDILGALRAKKNVPISTTALRLADYIILSNRMYAGSVVSLILIHKKHLKMTLR